jgi:hypothetical protein
MPLNRSVGNYFDRSGSFVRRIERWTGPASYVTGGEPCPPSTFSLGSMVKGIEGIASDGTTTRLVWWNPTTQSLQWFVPSSNVEVAAGVNLSTFSIQFEVVGL